MRLIHLSDIHFTAGDSWDPDLDQRDQLLRDVTELVDEGGSVDAILVGGDIAFSGAGDQYDVAAEWLEQIRVASGCPKGGIWVVPGNHDIDRNIHRANRAREKMVEELCHSPLDFVDARLAGWLKGGEGMLDCLGAYNAFSQQWVPPTTHKKPHWTDLTLDLDGLDVCLTGINSVVASDSVDWPKPKLVLGRQQCSLPWAENRVQIVFAHHPPSWIRDWENVEAYLRRAHLVLFGHEHQFRIEQAAPGLTVTVYSGAVGPERPGPDPKPTSSDGGATDPAPDDYVPCWDLIELHRSGDAELLIDIDPRVWADDEPRFVRHPDGVQRRRVRLDLKPIAVGGDGPTPAADGDATEPLAPTSGGAEHPGTNSSPLIPDSTEVQEGVPLPTPPERSELRALAVAFMRQTPTKRLHIAEQLDVADGLAEMELTASEEGREILRRIRAARKIAELRGLIDA
jgi:predicted MPP superfamily phosphohydrolase